MLSKPLEGVRIVDLSHTLAGPFATMVLADLGAEVIKVEPPLGDETRSWAPLIEGESAYFLSINRGKKSIAVNLNDPRGREIVYKLVRRSHVVIENYRPGVREKLGVDPETIFKLNRNIVYLSIKGFEPGSVYEGKPAYDIIIQALSGLMMSTGTENDPPIRVSFALFDIITGLMTSTMAIAGLLSKEKPYYAELYLYDVAIFAMSYIPMIYLLTGKKPKRMGSAHPSIVPYQAFMGSDSKWFILAAANDRLWRKFCESLNNPSFCRDDRFLTNPKRVENRDILIPLLEEVFSSRPRDYWVHLLEERNVPVAPAYELDEVFRDPYAKKLVTEFNHAKLGKIKQLVFPGKINGERPIARDGPPLLGDSTIEILEELGYSEKEINKLIEDKVVTSTKSYST